MTEHEDIARLLRAALPPATAQLPSRDLWPEVLRRTQTRTEWSWLDAGVAVLVVTALTWSPEWLWLLVYQL